jgi:hypothetical protein
MVNIAPVAGLTEKYRIQCTGHQMPSFINLDYFLYIMKPTTVLPIVCQVLVGLFLPLAIKKTSELCNVVYGRCCCQLGNIEAYKMLSQTIFNLEKFLTD